jgi:hypothetical protein
LRDCSAEIKAVLRQRELTIQLEKLYGILVRHELGVLFRGNAESAVTEAAEDAGKAWDCLTAWRGLELAQHSRASRFYDVDVVLKPAFRPRTVCKLRSNGDYFKL